MLGFTYFLNFVSLVVAGAIAAQPATANPIQSWGSAGVSAGQYLVVLRHNEDGQSDLVTLSTQTGDEVDRLEVRAPEFAGAPQIDAWRDTVVIGASGHEPAAGLATIFRVNGNGALSPLTSLNPPGDLTCLSMAFALEGSETRPHLTALCQEGGGALLVSEGIWPNVTLVPAFKFDLTAETVLGTAVLSKNEPKSALVALRGLVGLEGWALASLTKGNRVSPLIDGKTAAPVRVIAGDHPRLDRLILTGEPGMSATLGFDKEGQGGWQFLPPEEGDIALIADAWRNWLAIGWAAPGTLVPFTQETSQPIRIALYDLDRIAAEVAAPQLPRVTLKPEAMSRLWLGDGALVVTTDTSVTYRRLTDLLTE